jgi:hypothetical protein
MWDCVYWWVGFVLEGGQYNVLTDKTVQKEWRRIRWVERVPCLEEGYRESCVEESGMGILGRRATECGIILKWKK